LNKDLTSTRRLVDASQSSPQGRGPEISLRDSLGSAGSRPALAVPKLLGDAESLAGHAAAAAGIT